MKNWMLKPFSECAIFSPKISLVKGQSYSFIPMDVVKEDNKFVTPQASKIWSGSGGAKFENGDTLFARITPCLQNGKIAQAKNLIDGKGFGSTEFFVFRGKENVSDSDFVYYLAKTENFRSYAIGSMVGASGRQRADATYVGNFEVNLPPLPVQKRIASILSAYDDLIENNLKRIKLLEELARRTYEEWFVKFRVKGEELPINSHTGLPKDWEIKKIRDVFKTSSGGTPSRKKEEVYYSNGIINWIKTKELNNTIIITSEEKITALALKESSAKVFPSKTVLLAMYGNTIGETAFLSIDAATNQACCAFLCEEKQYRSYFIHQFLINQKQTILSYRMGAAQENISQDIIKSIEILMPNEELLIQFGSILEPFYSQIENLIYQNNFLKQSRDILLPRLMNGTITVKPET